MSERKSPPMRIYDGRGAELMTVRRLERDGDDLVIAGKIFGAMPMRARLKPEDARIALRLLFPTLIWFVLSLPFRRWKPPAVAQGGAGRPGGPRSSGLRP